MRPWVLVISEYLDLAYLLRQSGCPALTARSVTDALECLENWIPSRVIVDPVVPGWQQVLQRLSALPEAVPLEMSDEALERLLAN